MKIESPYAITEKETWKDVVGFEGYYKVSDLGRVMSVPRVVRGGNGSTKVTEHRILKPSFNGRGYLSVCFSKENKKFNNKLIHKLVATHFIERSADLVDHINGIKSDNRAINLRWVTCSENRLNSSKAVGVSRNKSGKTFTARITIDRDAYNLGCFPTFKEARRARVEAEEKFRPAINRQRKDISTPADDSSWKSVEVEE